MNAPTESQGTIRGALSRAHPAWFTLYAIGVSFTAYFAMYAFRKPFAVAKFEGQTWGPLELKTALVTSQIVGYTLSKYLGIKVCSEISPTRRAAALVLLVSAAEAALLLFGLLPAPWKVVAIFLNGLPLGMVWGMVVGYLEGRRTSELLLAGLSCSYIVASGSVKDVGRWLMTHGSLSEAWMPAATGALFLPLFLLSVWLLDQLPRPDEADVQQRLQRQPMNAAARGEFVRSFFLGLLALMAFYFYLTAYRDFRDNYGVEILAELGYEAEGGLFTRTELPVALAVMGVLALLNLVRDNRQALMAALAAMTLGTALLGVATLLFDAGMISGLVWMLLVGFGAYLAYVPFGTALFDRMIASTRVRGTAVFAIYLADAIGYTGSIGVQIYKDLAHSDVSRLGFFRGLTYVLAVLGTTMLMLSMSYFWRKTAPGKPPE